MNEWTDNGHLTMSSLALWPNKLKINTDGLTTTTTIIITCTKS